MLDKLTGKPVHLVIHFIACLAIAIGLPWSKIPLSLGTMLLFANLLLKADFKNYWQIWKQNPWLIALFLYVGLEWLSIAWSSNMGYVGHDFRVKLPLYALPLGLVAIPFPNRNWIYALCLAFLGSLFVTSILNYGYYNQWFGPKNYNDIRGLSLFVSHIRYALLVAMGIALLLGWWLRKLPFRWVALVLIVWFTYYTWYSQVVAGYISLLAILLTGTVLLIQNLQSKLVKRILSLSSVCILFIGGWWLYLQLKPLSEKVKVSELALVSKYGEPYYFEKNTPWENGYPVLAQIAPKEIDSCWNSVSNLRYNIDKDAKGTMVHYTLWRYMTSRGLTKDREGFSKLSKQEIQLIENGIASVELAKGGLHARLHSLRTQIQYPEDPNGHSMLQRFEYWKAAKAIIAQNWLFGVGAGDIDDAFQEVYESTNSKLLPQNRHRSHNQYLTTWITSGLLGLFAFLWLWIRVIRSSLQMRAFEWLCFAGIAITSFLIEDTLETQIGVTFIAFFFGLFAGNVGLFYRKVPQS